MASSLLENLTLGVPLATDIFYFVGAPGTVPVDRKGTFSNFVFFNGALGTPISGTLTNCTGLPIAGITGLGTGVATLLAGTPSGTGGLAGTTSPTFTTGINLNGTFTQTSASATAFESGPNGGTNPVLRLVNNVASQADGLSLSGGAAGAGATFTALSSGSNAPIILNPKGSAGVGIGGTPSALLHIQSGGNTYYKVQSTSTGSDAGIDFNTPTGRWFIGQLDGTSTAKDFHINDTNHSKVALIITDTSCLFAFGAGTGSPTHGIHLASTSGLTANQTMLVQDATATTGITGIFFNAGAAQSTNPILTVGGILRATKFNVNGTAGANFGPGLPTSITVVDGIVTAMS